jgi:hypothetical protein
VFLNTFPLPAAVAPPLSPPLLLLLQKYITEEWKKLLRTARNHRILHMPME